jgi:hypothetical protein
MKMCYILPALRDQLPLSRLWRTIRSGNIKGLLHRRSCMTHHGMPKVRYGSKASAQKAAKNMGEKTGYYFSNYRCFHCGGFHIGKNWNSWRSGSPTLYDPDYKA